MFGSVTDVLIIHTTKYKEISERRRSNSESRNN